MHTDIAASYITITSRTGAALYALILAEGSVIRFDIFSVWNFLLTVVVFASGGYLIFRANRAAYVRVLKETSEGWERAYKQKAEELRQKADELTALDKKKAEELAELKERLQRLQLQFDNQEKQHRDAIHQMRAETQEIVNLNIKLQFQLKDKEMEIVQLMARVVELETQVRELQRAEKQSGDLSPERP